MTTPGDQALSPLVRFPNFTDIGDLNSLSIIIQDLSVIYDITTVAVLPGYEQVPMPAAWIGPRRYSLLREADRLNVKRLSLSSPLEIVFYVATISSATGALAYTFERTARAAKTFLEVLAAGLDVEQRRQTLEENRALERERLRNLQLSNQLLEQRVRRVRAEADILEGARDELSRTEPYSSEEPTVSRGGRHRRIAGNMTDGEYAELLNQPITRLLIYGGGELEIAGDENDDNEPESS